VGGSSDDSVALAPLIVIVGQTASGKTATGIDLALKIDGEIICADSRTVYKGMDIGTAKPLPSEQKKVPHHLLDQVFPDEKFTANDFKVLANTKIKEIWMKKHWPILVGGTGLYIDSILYDFDFGRSDEELRKRLEQFNASELVEYATTNNISISGIGLGNKRHLVRAIERGGVQIKNKRLRARTLVLGLQLEKQVLQQRIEARAQVILDAGWIDEVKMLAEKYGWDTEPMKGENFLAARNYLEGIGSFEEVKQAFIKRDKELAKRQMTWFKRNPDIQWFSSPEELIEKATTFTKHFKDAS
jgi:tRNA dimethylallyltransferase